MSFVGFIVAVIESSIEREINKGLNLKLITENTDKRSKTIAVVK